MKLLFASARSAAVLLDENGYYDMDRPARLYLNGEALGEEGCSVRSLFGLWPGTDYTIRMERDGEAQELSFRTEDEACTLNVRRFGAKGDGIQDDTFALQAAILCCPPGGRVLIPKGDYVTGPLFLKSHITVEWQAGAALLLSLDRGRFPILPGVTYPTQEQGADYLLGSWEGNPQDCFAGALTGIEVEDVRLIGPGIIDGRARDAGWWIDPKGKHGAYRGRLFFLKGCRDITVQGLTFRNSPSWNIHPMMSERLAFYNIQVEAPADSPNTDGFDPESCRGVKLLGARFSVGDDCIAIKAGKIYMAQKYHLPCRDIEIAYCAMLDGHGGVTVGSEMAGGVQNVRVHHCFMRGNDRALRIKTRRGRGKDGVVDDIRFSDVRMEGVKAPLVVNCLYFCDPDGHTPWVQSRQKQPVDDTTPTVGSITFERVDARDCRACAGYILGLPERPAGPIAIRDSRFSFAENAQPMAPAMAEGVEAVRRRGVIARFARGVTLENTVMEGIEGDPLEATDCADS